MIFFTLLLSLVSSQDFIAYGINTNASIIFAYDNNCNFNSCQKVICNILNNTISAYVGLVPLKKMASCPNLPFNFKVNMITFIFKENQQMILPLICDTMGDCMKKGCDNFLSYKESYIMAFTGQCL